MKRIIPLASVILLCCSWEAASGAVINSYQDMPANRTTLFPNPYLDRDVLSSFGITKERWHNTYGWESGGDAAVSFFSNSNRGSNIAPFGQSLNDVGLRFTFSTSTPIYAVGSTQIATRYPDIDTSGSFDNNEQNTNYEMVAYDSEGRVIERAFSSSYRQIFGPVEYHATYGGIQFMASYVGIWTNVPIYQVTILGARPSGGELMSSTGSFSFSSTPAMAAVPEPSGIAQLLVGVFSTGIFARWNSFRRPCPDRRVV